MKALALIFLILPFSSVAQDLTGVWTGYLRTPGSQLKYELAISEYDNKYSGYSLIVYVNEGVENIGIKTAKMKRHKNELTFEDGELVYDNFKIKPQLLKMFGSLAFETKDTIMILRGNFSTRSLDFRDSRTYSGEVFLQKENNQLASKVLPKLEELKLSRTLSFVNSRNKKKPVNKPDAAAVARKQLPKDSMNKVTSIVRRNEKIRDIAFTSDSLQLSIYDNGTIDGDVVSLVLDGRIIANNVSLTGQAFRITVPTAMKAGDSLQLVMFAENLGSIPPNTGLLIINDGNTRHEILFESDLQRSSVITLRRRK